MDRQLTESLSWDSSVEESRRFVWDGRQPDLSEEASGIGLRISEPLGRRRCEPSIWEDGSWGRGQFGNQEERERPPLEAITKRLVRRSRLNTCHRELQTV
jgi:hypothetical protein